MKKIRYAVVGLGHIAQSAVLPSFRNAQENSELVGLVSGDQTKLDELGKLYGVKELWPYGLYEKCLSSGKIDAVYIALPNNMHKEFAIKALDAGIHVLCEKPMAPAEEECRQMIEAAAKHNAKLMVAYRLHFEESNLEAIETIRSGRIGEPRFFTSSFSQQVKKGNIRTDGKYSGGALYDLGVYCINAARYLFGEEPTQVYGFTATKENDPRFNGVEEMVAATMIFPNNKLASFTCSMGAADTSWFEVVGTKGSLRLDPAYGYEKEHVLEVVVDGKSDIREFSKRDQFGPELIYFSNCILHDKEPEPSGYEGLADVHVIRSIFESAQSGQAVILSQTPKRSRPSLDQNISEPPVTQPQLVNVQAPA